MIARAKYRRQQMGRGYRQTEIGIMPKDWNVARIGSNSLAKFDYDSLGMNTAPDYTFDYITLENVDNGKLAKIIPGTFGTASPRARRVVHQNDVLIATVRPLLHSHLYASAVFNGAVCSTGFCVISPDEGRLSGKYLYYLFFSDIIDRQIEAAVTGSNYPAISSNDIKNLIIPLPPPAEQHAIADALSDMDGYTDSLERLIAKKEAVKQGAMRELLAGKRRLPGFAGGWKEKTMGEMGSFYSGLTGKKADDFCGGNVTYITFLNVLSNTVVDISKLEKVHVAEQENQNTVKYGDLFFNTSSETPEEAGMCAVLLDKTHNTFLNSFCLGFRLNGKKTDPLFLAYYFNSGPGRKMMTHLAQGITRYNLSKTRLRGSAVLVPEFAEQRAIAAVLSDMDTEIKFQSARLDKARLVKRGMMQGLLSGRIRFGCRQFTATEGIVPFAAY
jgi:type I restriction enzyme S subunit